ncbi:hypothetical protein MAR_013452 [Mya arenaria]|uniref:G-protein coupled receptors family 1 profile domain-containing protein n=1 Tax=Mya arenaria TaxID=6604 RepID=A0ABY7FZV6_MYAAR|nr:uncharacterized protein LOC128220807 [Mya arenaria]XP_052785327.1 uncharacterized protein LOC128220807 [Mya arenaria]XP_052785328.1 uncharacterized protein LOC128220807 [Mya arenaria]WAR27748.1 hypothetical protein MAR_013452 [Mya arenaria]
MAKDGYDFPVYGLNNGMFYPLHIPSLVCTAISFACVIITLVLMIKSRNIKSFFTSWSKSERFIHYMALCDGSYNIFHFATHAHVAVVQGPVYPRSVCVLYAFGMIVFVTAQSLLANLVAVNAFMLMYLDKYLNLGRYDWRLIAWVFGAPIIGSTFAAIFEQLGPTGAVCAFDGVNGRITQICFTTGPMILIFVANVALYTATWIRIRSRSLELRRSLGAHCAAQSIPIKAAKAMSLFVGAFFIQWMVVSVYGTWAMVNNGVPDFLEHLYHILPDIGGLLNLIVLLMIRRGNLLSNKKTTPTTTETDARSCTKHSKDSTDGIIPVGDVRKIPLHVIENEKDEITSDL